MTSADTKTKYKVDKGDDITFAFVCETPLQLFNAMNFVANDMEDSRGKSDIYIYHNFTDSRQISARLRESKLFVNVYDIDRYNEDVDRYTRLRILYRLFCPKNALKRHLTDGSIIDTREYKYLVMYSFTMRNRHFLASYRSAQVLMIEDGIGAYHSNQMKDYVEGYYRILDRYVFGSKYDCQPVRMYVYRPDICKNDITDSPLQLPHVDERNPVLEYAYKVYGYIDNDAYQNKRIVYFTQPLGLLPAIYRDGSDGDIVATIGKLGLGELITRIHPRQSDIELYGSEYDRYNNFWELESAKSITSEHILVSAFSTAMFTPKYISGAEPYIIFTYKLSFQVEDTAYWNNLQKFFDMFVQIYDDKDKIAIPETLAELEDALRRFAQG